jgi:hypothetical protein
MHFFSFFKYCRQLLTSCFTSFTEIARVFAAHALHLEAYQFTVATVPAALVILGSHGTHLAQRIVCDTMTIGGTVVT